MPMISRISLVVAFVAGAGVGAQATQALAANNYDSPDWAPIYTGPTIGREPTMTVHRKDVDRIVQAPIWHLSHKVDHPR
jgi:hypothetical protein